MLLASVFYYAIIEVKNQDCQAGIKEIDKKFVESFDLSDEQIYFESAKAESQIL